MGMEPIYILGVGHNTINIIELALDCGYEIGGLIHFNESRTGEIYFGYPIIGSYEKFLTPEFIRGKNVTLSMGDLKIKDNLFKELKDLGAFLPTLIHPSSHISRFCKIGYGVQIQAQCIIEGDSIISDNTTVVVNTVIHHNSYIGYNNLISGNVIIGAYCNIGDFVHIGQGAVVVSGKVGAIGDNSILGAGSVLLSDMPANSVYVGNPAKLLKFRN